MVIIDGNCVICAKYKSVLSLGDKNAYLKILNINLFHEDQNRFNKFSKLFAENPNSICVSCAYIIDLYNTNKSSWTPENKSKKYCVLCCNEESEVFKCLSELKNSISRFTEHKITSTVKICLNCSFCLDGWNDIKNSVKQLVDSSSLEELNSTTVSSSTSNTAMKRRRHSVNSKEPVPLKRAKKAEKLNINNNSNEPNNKKGKPARGRFEKQIQQEKNNLDKKLQHLVTVDNETIDRNMKLSFSVLTDQKMMFEIPYIACDSIPSQEATEFDSSVKFVSYTRSKQKRALKSDSDNRKNNSNTSVDIIVDHKRVKQEKLTSERKTFKNNSDYSVEIGSHGKVMQTKTSQKKVSKLQDPKNDFDDSLVERSISKQKPRPKSKQKFPKKGKVVETEVFNCTKCNKILETNYTFMLHELEHENSFSPTIVLEQQDLAKILKEYKDKNSISNSQESFINKDATLEEGQLLNKNVIQEKDEEIGAIIDKDPIQEREEETVEINEKNDIEEMEEETPEAKDKDAMEEKDEGTVEIKDNNAIEKKKKETVDVKDKYALEEMEEETVEIKDKDVLEKVEEGTVEIEDKDVLEKVEEGTVEIEDDDVLEKVEEETVEIEDDDVLEKVEEETVEIEDEDVLEKVEEGTVEIEDKDVLEKVEEGTVEIEDSRKEKVMTNEIDAIEENGVTNGKNEVEEEEEMEIKNKEAIDGKEETVNINTDKDKEKSTDDTQTNQDKEEEEEAVEKIDSSDVEENKESENEGKDSEESPEKTEEADENKSNTDDDHSGEKTNDDNESAMTEKDDVDGEKENDACEEKDEATEKEGNRKLNADQLEEIPSEEAIETNGVVLKNGESNGIESENAIASGEESEYDMDPLKISNSSEGSSPDKNIIEEEDFLQKPFVLTDEIDKKSNNRLLPDSDRFKIMEDILNNLGA